VSPDVALSLVIIALVLVAMGLTFRKPAQGDGPPQTRRPEPDQREPQAREV
jgi:hypothetical protein